MTTNEKIMLDALRDLIQAHDTKMGAKAVHLRIELAKDAVNKVSRAA